MHRAGERSHQGSVHKDVQPVSTFRQWQGRQQLPARIDQGHDSIGKPRFRTVIPKRPPDVLFHGGRFFII